MQPVNTGGIKPWLQRAGVLAGAGAIGVVSLPVMATFLDHTPAADYLLLAAPAIGAGAGAGLGALMPSIGWGSVAEGARGRGAVVGAALGAAGTAAGIAAWIVGMSG